jgi:lysophospholipase L1-like esterase
VKLLRICALALIFTLVGLAVLAAADAAAALAYAAFVPVEPARSPPAETGAVRLAVYGDSLAYGQGASHGHGWIDDFARRIRARRPGSDVDDFAIRGARVRDVNAQVTGARVAKPTAVLIVAGTNDVIVGIDPLTLARDYSAMLAALRARYPGARLLVTNVPDVARRRPGGTMQHLNPLMRGEFWLLTQVYDGIIAGLAARYGAVVIDLNALTRRPDAFDARYVSDGFHPNDRGYAAYATFAWPTVAAALGLGI